MWEEKLLNEAEPYFEKGIISQKLLAVLRDWIDTILDHAKRSNSANFFDYLKYHDIESQLEQGYETFQAV